MWIGLLTAGTHPGRPTGSTDMATLFTWGPRERARCDGPESALAAGVRMMRRTGRTDLSGGHDPRCFDCREPYLIPDPVLVRARDDIRELGARVDEGAGECAEAVEANDAAAAGPDARGTPSRAGSAAVFALVHVEDVTGSGEEGEALVYVPGSSVVSLIPFACPAAFAAVIREVGYAGHHCQCCGTLPPGGALAEPSRAARRRAARRAA